MGKNHFPPIKPKPPGPGPGPVAPGVPLIWWTDNANGRTDEVAGKANVGIATLIIQRDEGTLWRVGQDKPPYTWTQIAAGSGGGDKKDPYTAFYPDRSLDPATPVDIKPWMRVIDDGFGRTYRLPDLEPGDSFEIVDTAHLFGQRPVTLIKNDNDHFGFLLGVRDVDPAASSIKLDVIGEGSVWRFTTVNADIIAVLVPTFSEG